MALPNIGKDKIEMSPTIVVNKFVNDWEENLMSVDYAEGTAKMWFVEWYLQRFGSSKESVMWLIESRWLRTLQERLAVLRSQSGK